MTKSKLKRIAELSTLPNILLGNRELKGRWKRDCFMSEYPITIELGCGWGEYSIELAGRFPRHNFIGIDLKGTRLWKAAKIALEMKLTNVVFLKARIEQIGDYFAPGEISEIWLPFPDPYPKRRQVKHRLTAPHFLETYKSILSPGGRVHLKTDAEELFEYTLQVLESAGCIAHIVIDDLYGSETKDDLITIQTKYERKHLALGKAIKYVSFSFR